MQYEKNNNNCSLYFCPKVRKQKNKQYGPGHSKIFSRRPIQQIKLIHEGALQKEPAKGGKDHAELVFITKFKDL